MKFDDILKAIGEFGPFQMRVFFMTCLAVTPMAMNWMANVFFSGNTDHWCAVPAWQENYDACGERLGNDGEYLGCLYKYRNASIPIEEKDGGSSYSQCTQYNIDYQEYAEGYYFGDETNATVYCRGWVYDKSDYTRTIKTDFDLVCDRKAAADITQSAWFAGILVGSLFFGQLSDIIGRYYTFYISLGGSVLMSVATAFTPNLWTYTTTRTATAFFCSGINLVACVIGLELVGPSKRVLAGTVISVFFASGSMLLAVVAYFVRDWRVLQIIIVAPLSLFLLTIPFVPESTRWLITKKKYNRAEDIILKAARVNKKERNLPDNFMDKLKESEDSRTKHADKTVTMVDLFKTPRLRLSTMNLMYNWFINNLVYYGLSLSTSDLGSNNFVAFFISGAVEIPAYILAFFIIQSPLGRRYSTMGFELLGGTACLLTIFFPLGTVRTAIAMVGKFGISASFGNIYIYSAEIFPTPARAAGIGLCSTAARVSGIMAPLILLLDDYWEPFPLVIFGSACITGGLLAYFLPETRGKRLPETMAEGEKLSTVRTKNSNYEGDVDIISSKKGETNLAIEAEDTKM